MVDRPSELVDFKNELVSLAERVVAVDIRAYESMPPDRLVSELQPHVSAMLVEAHRIVARLLDLPSVKRAEGDLAADASALASPYAPFEQAIDAAMAAQSMSSLQAVADIAFLAHLELRQRAERLERVMSCRNAIAIIGECDSALRRARKALTSIDVAFARAGIGESTFDFASELELSLRVRKACAKLRDRVLAGGEPSKATMQARLRAAGTAMAMLVGWEIYPSLRVRDRLQLREVQRRILDWLRTEKDPTDGLRLWQDLVTFIRMLAQVNRRQELVEHDARVIYEALELLSKTDEVRSPELLRLLESLEGLDDELDARLAARADARPDAWREIVARLARGFNRPRESR